jgi:general secretion pathway protein J
MSNRALIKPLMRFSRVIQSGFTLIEVLISMALSAILSLMSYQALEVVMDVNERSRNDTTNDSQLQRAWQIIGRDLLHMRPRTYADGLGGTEKAYLTNPSEFGLRFSRGGGPMLRSNPSGLRRIDYHINTQNQLIRTSWAITDSPRQSEGSVLILLDNVVKIELNHLDNTRNYSIDWPPINSSLSDYALPRMISMTITTDNNIKTSRLIPGVIRD